MISIQSSSYGVSALVSSQLPAATRNGETDPAQAKTPGNDKVEGARPAGDPPSGAGASAQTADKAGAKTGNLESGDREEPREKELSTSEAFEAAARHFPESIDLREEDNTANPPSGNSGVSFDEAGTYRPAWVK